MLSIASDNTMFLREATGKFRKLVFNMFKVPNLCEPEGTFGILIAGSEPYNKMAAMGQLR